MRRLLLILSGYTRSFRKEREKIQLFTPLTTPPFAVWSVHLMSLRHQQSFKVVLLGEGRVGKTSLVLRFCRDTFVDGQPPTIQASCLERALRIGDKSVNLVIWDTAGQERFHALGPIYYRDADAALLVYDITDTDSFKRIQAWVRELRKMVSRPAAPVGLRAGVLAC